MMLRLKNYRTDGKFCVYVDDILVSSVIVLLCCGSAHLGLAVCSISIEKAGPRV